MKDCDWCEGVGFIYEGGQMVECPACKLTLSVPELIIVRGGCAELTPRVCEATQTHYGIREGYTAYLPVYMLDWDFNQPWDEKRWATYLQKVRDYQPHLVMTPDYFEHVPYALLQRQIAELRHVIPDDGLILVCPKFDGAIAHIPSDCRVAISVPVGDEYGGFLPMPDEVAGRDLHLLGGHPDQWAYLQNVAYTQSVVQSIDGNFLIRGADAYGKMWGNQGRYLELHGQNLDSEWLAIASIRNVRTYLAQHPIPFQNSRVRLCQRELARHIPDEQMVLL